MPQTLWVLIVEDEWLVAQHHASHLRDLGHQIVGPCATVAAALAAIDEQRVDAALLDVELRTEKSYPVAAELARRGIPFTFVSGHADIDLPAALRDRPLLSKPVDVAALARAVDRMGTTA